MENSKFEVKDLTGTIFMDAQLKDGKDGPYEVRSGSCKVNGVEYWINAYAKTTKTGKEILSLTFKPKQTGPMTQTDILPKQAPSLDQVPLDQIPF